MKKINVLMSVFIILMLSSTVLAGSISNHKKELTNDKLMPGQVLYPNQYIQSQNHNYILKMMSNGYLEIYKYKNNKAIWSFEWTLPENNKCFIEMSNDGYLALYYYNANPKIFSPIRQIILTTGRQFRAVPGSYLQLQNNGNLVLYSPDHKSMWSTKSIDNIYI